MPTYTACFLCCIVHRYNTKNKQCRLASALSTFSRMMETWDEGVFGCDEVMLSYVLKAAENGKRVVRVLSDDTDMFVLLVYWVYWADLELLCKLQMQRWDRTVLCINATCVDIGPKCLQLLGMHTLSGCDTTSYGKGKISALNTLLAQDFPCAG